VISERLTTFFRKVKTGLGERLSEVKPEDIANFATKEAVGAIHVVGPFLKDVIDEFSPDEKEESCGYKRSKTIFFQNMN
jgi:hypothetical protein